MSTTSNAFKAASMKATKATGKPLETPTLILVGVSIDEGAPVTIDTLTELVATGYAASAGLVYGEPYIRQDGKTVMSAPSVEFRVTADTPDAGAYGWAVVNAAKTALHFYQKFDSAVPMNLTGMGLMVQPDWVWGD